MNDFSITMPCGQIRILMRIDRMMDYLTKEVVRQEGVSVLQLKKIQCSGPRMAYLDPPREESYVKKEHKLLPVYQESEISKLKALEIQNRNAFKDHHDQALKAFLSERFKNLVTRKSVEFYVPNLNLEKVEELSVKYMDGFGSENAVMTIFKLSDYHKFAAIVDVEHAFKIFMNEDYQAELVEIAPSKWVLGRYGEDMTLIKEMEGMRRYSF